MAAAVVLVVVTSEVGDARYSMIEIASEHPHTNVHKDKIN